VSIRFHDVDGSAAPPRNASWNSSARVDASRRAMPFKPNYRMQRADRQRAKEQKQQKKIQRRAEKAAKEEPVSSDAPSSDLPEVDEAGPHS
jgi:hypothetical protein